jgi:hypothetical protein
VPKVSLSRARDLLQIIDVRDKTYSVERAGKLDFIDGKLKSPD